MFEASVTVRGPNVEAHYVITNPVRVDFWTRSWGGIQRPFVTDNATVILTHGELVFRVFPNPFEPRRAVRGTLKFSGLPAVAKVRIFTLAGAEVKRLNETQEHHGGAATFEHGSHHHWLEWDGRNEQGTPVGEGVYLYVVEIPDEKGGKRYLKGKFGLKR